jgi:hypothetical protein
VDAPPAAAPATTPSSQRQATARLKKLLVSLRPLLAAAPAALPALDHRLQPQLALLLGVKPPELLAAVMRELVDRATVRWAAQERLLLDHALVPLLLEAPLAVQAQAVLQPVLDLAELEVGAEAQPCHLFPCVGC